MTDFGRLTRILRIEIPPSRLEQGTRRLPTTAGDPVDTGLIQALNDISHEKENSPSLQAALRGQNARAFQAADKLLEEASQTLGTDVTPVHAASCGNRYDHENPIDLGAFSLRSKLEPNKELGILFIDATPGQDDCLTYLHQLR